MGAAPVPTGKAGETLSDSDAKVSFAACLGALEECGTDAACGCCAVA